MAIRSGPLSFVLILLSIAAATHAADAPPKDEVSLELIAAEEQPAGWPLIVEINMKNIGSKPISWWCGGPARYPYAENFVVKVRYDAEDEWHTVEATNGQYTQGSGGTERLKPGESIVVPLAIPVRKADSISVTIQPEKWRAKPAECSVSITDARRVAASREAPVIEGAIAKSPFWKHVAARYPSPVVLDALLKLLTVDNVHIANTAAEVLAWHETLPPEASQTLADMVERWLSRSGDTGFDYYLVTAALKTRGEAARAAVLKSIKAVKGSRGFTTAVTALAWSPGDKAWLRRAREAIVSLQRSRADDPELIRETKHAIESLDSRIANEP